MQGCGQTPSATSATSYVTTRIKPFDLALAAEWAYYLVYPPRALARPKLAAFRDWLLAEAARDRGAERAAPTRAA